MVWGGSRREHRAMLLVVVAHMVPSGRHATHCCCPPAPDLGRKGAACPVLSAVYHGGARCGLQAHESGALVAPDVDSMLYAGLSYFLLGQSAQVCLWCAMHAV